MNNFKPHWKIFWMTFVPMFIMVALQLLGVKTPRIISPIGEESKVEALLKEKLASIPNTYTLNKPNMLSLVQPSYASTYANGASSYAIIDFDNGDVIAEKDLSHRLPIASLTKIMTAVTALDLMDPEEVLTVSPTAAQVIPTRIGVIPGQKMTLTELLNGILLTSANDAAETIRDNVDAKYGKGTFVRSMNTKAQLIGLKNSHFSNPQGFDSAQNYSTSEDLAILSHYALKNYPLIAEICKKRLSILATR